jgi:L-alanine-DL-glutamate epimerase-like enolase superfamily enzyme
VVATPVTAIRPGVPVTSVETSVYRIPTDLPESDGTFAWHDTTMVVAEVSAGSERGIGYTYSTAAAARLIDDVVADAINGVDAMSIPAAWLAMVRAIRNLGRPGISSMAIAAVDTALWDLKAKLLGVSLLDLLGAVRSHIPVYGSGGFTSYSDAELRAQFEGWRADGIGMMKMKVGRDAAADIGRVRVAREAIGDGCELFVDANGAYTRKQALAQAERFAEERVAWFEEPVSSDDLDGLRLMRDRAPAGMASAAGEDGFDLPYFRGMLDAGAVDVLQADATRCAGITGFLATGALCEARSMPFSAHCAPSLHAAACCALPQAVHVEYFHDHARIEQMLFDGALVPRDGALWPDTSRPGIGIELKRADAARYAI